MSTVATMEPKKPSRRLSMSGFFTAPWTKKERKVAVVTRIEPKDVVIEEAAILSYTQVKRSSPKVERAHVVKDNVLAVGKVPVPKEEIARNAVNREIRFRQTSKVTRKRSDASHRGGLFDSFRGNRKHKVKTREAKSPISSGSYPNMTSPTVESVPNLTALARARNIAMYADETPQFERVHNRSTPNCSRVSYEQQYSDDGFYGSRASRMYDMPSKYLTTGHRSSRSHMSDRFDASDDDGIGSGTHTPVSFIVTQCSMSDSDSSLQNDFPAPMSSALEDCDDIDEFVLPTSVIANVTLPRHRKPSKNNSKLDENKRSKSQESLLTTIVNAVTQRTGSSNTECSEEASQFASSIASSLVGSCSSFRPADDTAAETDDGSSQISKPSRHNSMDKGVGEGYKSNFITWEGRESVTLPRPRHRKIGNVDNLTEAKEKETTRDFSWHAVKAKPKKGPAAGNVNKANNMMINKLPAYGNSLQTPVPYFTQDGRVHGLPVRPSFQKPTPSYDSGKPSDATDSKYSKLSYRDDADSTSLHSGTGTPPHQLSHYSNVSGSTESIDEGLSAVDPPELDDPDLVLKSEPEPEAWSVTVDKKVLDKMHKKNIKRQDNIFEFIQKERNFLTTLKIMQKIFAYGMMRELHYDQEVVVDKMFPQIDEFVEFTSNFVEQLDQRQREHDHKDKVVSKIGDILVEQWSGENGRQMLWLFGEFCSKQKEIVSLYKDMLKNDKKFQDFVMRCGKNPLTRRRDIPGCILLVTQRITKYPVILKTLIDNSARKEHKSDTSNLNHALELVTDIIKKVDKQVLEYEKKMRVTEIYQKMESKSYATYKDGRKFTRDDFYPSISKLLQVDTLQWRPNTVKRAIDVVVVLFKDVLVFLQENNQRYSFASVNQPAAVPLHKLIVREKAGEDSVLFLLSASSDKPEMYELVFQTAAHSKNWMQWIRSAVDACPEEDEGVSYQDVEEQRLMEQKWVQADQIISDLEAKDRELNDLLQEKMKKFKMLAKVLERPEVTVNMKYSYPTYLLNMDDPKSKRLPEGKPTLQKAIDEVHKLSHAICGPGGLNRNPSSVGEHDSGSHHVTSLPKRSETFGGFDNGKEPPSPRTRFATIGSKYTHKQDSEADVSKYSSRQKRAGTHSEGDITSAISSPPSGAESPSGSHGQLGIVLPPTPDQISALAELTHFLNEYMSIATQQDTHVQKMSLNLMRQSQSRKRGGDKFQAVEARRNQAKQSEMEQDLTKREEQLKSEKDQWIKEHRKKQLMLEAEKQEFEEKFEQLRRHKYELEREQDELKRNKDEYQKQLARLREQQRKHPQEHGMTHSTSHPNSLTANKNNSNSVPTALYDQEGWDENQNAQQSKHILTHGLGSMPSHLSKSHSSLEGELGENPSSKEPHSPTYSAGDYPRTFPGPGKWDQSQPQSIQAPINAGQGGSSKPIHLRYSAANQVVDHMATPHSVIPGNLSSAKSKHGSHQVIPSKLKGLSGLQSSQNTSKPTLKSKLLSHKKGSKSSHGPSELSEMKSRSNTLTLPNSMKHSKSDANLDIVGARNRSTSSPSPAMSLLPPDTESGLERSNSASSNSSKEGHDKKKGKKRRSWGTNDKPGEKQIYQV